MSEPHEGMWDFEGPCAPNEDGSNPPWGQETFTLGCFQWVRMARGKKLKKGKISYRIKGHAADPAPVYAAARAYCAKKNAEASQ